MGKHCGYCYHYSRADTIKVTKYILVKLCEPRDREVEFSSKHCRYYKPLIKFFCNAYHERLNITDCLIRRYNTNSLEKFKDCIDCQQFKNEIKDTISEYLINSKQILEPPKPKTLKIRRKKKDEPKLKRRRKRKAN